MPITPAHQVVAQPLSWLWQDRIPLGKLLILAGIEWTRPLNLSFGGGGSGWTVWKFPRVLLIVAQRTKVSSHESGILVEGLDQVRLLA